MKAIANPDNADNVDDFQNELADRQTDADNITSKIEEEIQKYKDWKQEKRLQKKIKELQKKDPFIYK